MFLLDAATFIGRFHPLLVHLPIGFLLLSAILAVLGRKEKYQAIQPAISFALLTGTICAVLACITGFVLSSGGDYDADTLTIHMTGGFITAGVSLFAYLLSAKIITLQFLQTARALLITLVIMVITISVTGHFGGTLTHGSGYISYDLLFAKQEEKKRVTDINEAMVYEDIVQPILEKKCSGCHNSRKKKGELSMENFKSLMKGGKHGVVLEAGNAAKSELIKRVSLNPKDEKFMPADNKPPLNDNEKNIVTWWIEKTNAVTGKKIKEVAATDIVKKDIIASLGLQNNGESEDDDDSDSTSKYFASLKIPAINEQQLAVIKQSGFVIKYINLKPLLLDITLPENKNNTVDSINTKLKALLTVKANIIWLNVSGNNISDGQLQPVSLLTNLQRLKLDNNPVTDAGVSQLKTLANLESLNLYNTKVTNQSIATLASLPKLKHLYVWGTGVKKEDSTLKVVTGVNQEGQ